MGVRLISREVACLSARAREAHVPWSYCHCCCHCRLLYPAAFFSSQSAAPFRRRWSAFCHCGSTLALACRPAIRDVSDLVIAPKERKLRER